MMAGGFLTSDLNPDYAILFSATYRCGLS